MRRIVLLTGLILAACPGPASRTFTMSLGNFAPCPPNQDCLPPVVLEVPATVTGTATLKVRLSVVTGNGCQSFERLEVKREAVTLEITPIGRETLNIPCAQVAGSQWVEYDDPPSPTRSSPFTVIVRQATGPDFTRQVTVTP